MQTRRFDATKVRGVCAPLPNNYLNWRTFHLLNMSIKINNLWWLIVYLNTNERAFCGEEVIEINALAALTSNIPNILSTLLVPMLACCRWHEFTWTRRCIETPFSRFIRPEVRNFNPINMYRTVISVIGVTKNNNVDIWNEYWSMVYSVCFIVHWSML